MNAATDGLPKIPGLTRARWRVYCIYADADRPLCVSEAARELQRAVSTVHEQIGWLVEHGLLIDHDAGCYAGRYTAVDDPWEVAARLRGCCT